MTQPAALTGPAGDSEQAAVTALAVLLLFGAVPTDRALAGWLCGADWLEDEMRQVGVLDVTVTAGGT